MLFPLDTVKTRIQSAQGFLKAGGFKGVYSGVGSVGMGSAPGGRPSSFSLGLGSLLCCRPFRLVASAFFVTYEALKARLPRLTSVFESQPGLNHMVAASGAEFVTSALRPSSVLD